MAKTKMKKAVKSEAAPEEEAKKKKKKAAPEPADDDDDDVVEGDDDGEEEEVVDTTYVSDLRSMELVAKGAESDAIIVKKLQKLTDPEARASLVVQHAKNLISSSENSTLGLGEALYEIRANGYWKKEKDNNGEFYTKMETLWTEQFGISPVTGYRAIKLYEKLVVELELDVEEISQINMTVWRQVLDVINEENYEEVRAALEGMTSKDAEAFAKNAKRIGVEEAIAAKDEDEDLPSGSDTDEDGEDTDDEGTDEAEESIKTIKFACAESVFNLFEVAIESAQSILPEIKGEKKDAGISRALNHILNEWLSSSFSPDDTCRSPEEYINLTIAALEESYGIKLTSDDEEGEDE